MVLLTLKVLCKLKQHIISDDEMSPMIDQN